MWQKYEEDTITFLALCCCCQKVRDAQGNWHDLETYLYHNYQVKFTHTYCPSCAQELLAEVYQSAG